MTNNTVSSVVRPNQKSVFPSFKLSRSMTHRVPLQGLIYISALLASNAWAQTQDTATTFTYDETGNVKTITRPLGRITAYTYDALSRTTQANLTVGSTTLVTKRSYDGQDQISSITDPRALITSYDVDGLGDRTHVISPDTSQSNYTFDEAGNVLTHTDARGKTTRFQYDALGRLLQAEYQTGVASTFEYDGGPGGPVSEVGNLTRINDESGYTTFTHDAKRRVLTKTQVVIAGVARSEFTVQYSYGTTGSAIGKLESITYPSAARVNYRYDASGRVGGVTLNKPNGGGEVTLLENITYTSTGAIQSWQWGDKGLPAYRRTYDLDGRLTSYPIDLLGTVRTISYNAANLATAYNHVGGSNPAQFDQAFEYDTADRLTSFRSGGATTTYTYDANGNRARQTGPDVIYTYSASSNRLISATFSMPRTYAYDSAGNRIGDGLHTFVYGDRGRLSQVRGNSNLDMFYNAFGQRVLKAGVLNNTYYAYDEAGRVIGEYVRGNTSATETIYLEGIPIAVVTPQQYYYVVADHIDTPLVVANASGTVVWDWRSRDAFASIAPVNSPELANYNHRFPGQIADVETGLFYNYFRDYDPQTGRYLESDPIGLDGGINTYAYVGGNPLSNIDPDGLQVIFKVDRMSPPGYAPSYSPMYAKPGYEGGDRSRGDPDAARRRESNAGLRQSEYENAKNFCDTPPPSGSNDCSTLSKQIDHAEQCIKMYETWDNRWLPGRHDEKLSGWRNRLENLKNTHKAKYTQKCP